MTYLGYACVCASEIINDCRTLSFIQDGRGPEGLQCRDCDPCCEDITMALHGGGYNITDAPWYDGSEDSLNFAGLLVQTVDGLGPGEYSRSSTPLASGGTSHGRAFQAGPVVVVRALVMARTCAANDFALRWLRKELRDSCDSSGCEGSDLVYLTTEPQTPDLDCPENANFDYEAWLAPYFRTMKNVVLISGPTVVETIPRACPTCSDCGIPVVEFTLGSGRPCVYLDPIASAAMSFSCEADDDDECIEWITDDEECSLTECEGTVDCATDPDCVASTKPPTVPVITNPCVDDCISSNSCSVTLDIPDSTFPFGTNGTLDIEIFSGSAALRRVKIQVWSNPTLIPVDELADCDACTELNVSYVPAQSTLNVDGSTESSTIDCAGGSTVRANPFIGGDRAAAVFGYPDLDGDGYYTVLVSAIEPVASDAFVRISAVGKEC